jgi:hypothetical protein
MWLCHLKSAGSGWGHRIEAEEIVGSALVYGKNVIHAAFFKMTEEEKAGSMSSLGRSVWSKWVLLHQCLITSTGVRATPDSEAGLTGICNQM